MVTTQRTVPTTRTSTPFSNRERWNSASFWHFLSRDRKIVWREFSEGLEVYNVYVCQDIDGDCRLADAGIPLHCSEPHCKGPDPLTELALASRVLGATH